MAEVVNMLPTNKDAGPTPQELQKVAKEFAEVMKKLVVVLKNSGIEGKHLPDAVKPSDVVRVVSAVKESSDNNSGPKI